MKRIVLILAVALGFLLLGCIGGQSEGPSEEATTEFTDGYFSLEYPSSWQAMDKQGEEDVLNRIGGPPCALSVKKYPTLTPGWVKYAVSGYMPDAEWNGDVFEGDLTLEGKEYHFKNTLVFCDCATYMAGVGCSKNSFDAETANKIINSAECSYEPPPAYSGKGKVGMVVVPPGDRFFEVYCSNIKEARAAGAYLTHMYFSWGAGENPDGSYNWTMGDYVVEVNKRNDMKMSAVISIVYTNQVGEIPSDIEFESFSDPEFKERFADFAVAFLDRYGDTVEYLEIGNEVNIYLAGHRDEVDDYREFYSYVYNKVKEKHPETKVGTVFAYHAARDSNSTDIIEALSDVGDFNAFTLYIHGPDFAFNRSITEAQVYFDEIDAISPKPFAMTEVGWSSSAMLQSSEARQAEYIDEVFSILEEKRDRVEFLAWFASNDIEEEPCRETAEGFITEDIEFLKETEYMTYFEEFICTQGLKDTENDPKLGWYEWVKKSREYSGID